MVASPSSSTVLSHCGHPAPEHRSLLSVPGSEQPGSPTAGSILKSMRPSPSLSTPSSHTSVLRLSLESFALLQPGSAGESINPSPSLSIPSLHAGNDCASLLPVGTPEHPGSSRSMNVSASLSKLSSHCGQPVAPFTHFSSMSPGPEQPGSPTAVFVL